MPFKYLKMSRVPNEQFGVPSSSRLHLNGGGRCVELPEGSLTIRKKKEVRKGME
jgi:hypothetical protein